MTRRTLRQQLKYRFDNTMSRRPFVLIPLWILTAFVVGALFALLLSFVDHQPSTFRSTVSQMWQRGLGILYIQDGKGNFGIETLTVLFGLVTLMVSPVVAGLVIIAAMKRITQLVSGRSAVLEQGHTVILGWSDQIYPVISGLVQANESRGKTTITVLADKTQTDMQELIKRQVSDTGSTRIVCRTGSAIEANDIKLMNLEAARSIITLSPDGPGADKQVIKTLLAVTNSPDRTKAQYHVVASVADSRNHPAAQLAGGAETIVIDADDISARLVVLTALQSGVSAVYTELLAFAGDEIYIAEEPALQGRPFGEALLAYDTSSVIGLLASDGTVRVKPQMATVIGQGDRIIALSAEETTVRMARQGSAVVDQAIVSVPPRPPAREATLVLGWNRRGKRILQNLDFYLGGQSTVQVVAGEGHGDTVQGLISDNRWTNIAVSYTVGDASDRETLERLNVEQYEHVIVLASDDMDVQEADAHTLVTLLHLRDMHDGPGKPGRHYSIVSEMLDDRNRKLGELTQADDFVVSPKLISMLMTQLSENRHLAGVFSDLFGPEGAEIYLKPVEDYVLLAQETDFYTVIEAARRREEVAIGYRSGGRGSGVVLNPDKSKKVVFKPGDRVIVIAEH